MNARSLTPTNGPTNRISTKINRMTCWLRSIQTKNSGSLRRKRDDRKLYPSSGGVGRIFKKARTTLRIKGTRSKRPGGGGGAKLPARSPSLIGVASTTPIREL